jgi:hypothetical protein
MLRCCLGLDAFFVIKACCQAFLIISLHVIIFYTCGVLYVLTLAIFLVYCCYTLLLRRWILLLGVRAPGHLPMVWCFVPLRRPLGLVVSFIIRLDVINTSYTVYFIICCFMCET